MLDIVEAPMMVEHNNIVHRHHKSDQEEKEEGPHPLQLLLEKSKFDCGGKSDGYYADSDVGCQAFHYCVTGQKHSMMCPAGTVFHQVHLNCVPEDQDICSKADKFYFVNNYLNKPLEQRGPNNTVQYHQRYYPEGYAVGDPFVPPQEANRDQRQQQQQQPPAATYGLGPAYREQSPQPQPAYQQVAPAHRPQPAAHRPAQPAPYAPPQHYPAQPRPAPVYQHQAAARPQPAQPAVYGYGAQQEQAYQSQAAQAQRAYNQQQYQAAAPQQHLYAQGAPRQRYQ
ncbi:U-scoloptoxin(01)-Cw1a like protein [Argiope bruennichi]|uniref:U-scoloptoxin(01)-Cw1a like protein n=1 Tax=Argiope bruennichi TaxID=94029 RepID=A0A8T0F0E9_ARGBR|nr:U-scoloptoxin(01)-Cw1a like protein [Argiope bruennichi]